MFTKKDEFFMREAFKLAQEGSGITGIDPLVGAVIVKDNKIVGKGFHLNVGSPHAETLAIKQAQSKTQGATLYINLEPCCHWGNNPPCTPQIIKAGIKRVVAAMVDPNPLICGKGIKELERAGVKIEVGFFEKEAKRINEVFIKYISTGKPFVIMKAAQTLDGKIATHHGLSKWISSDASRKFADNLRKNVDAIMVGVGTVLNDDPFLSVKSATARQPVKIIIDSLCRTPFKSNLFRNLNSKIIIASTDRAPKENIFALEKAGAEVLLIGKNKKRVDLKKLVEELGKRKITSILLEGGGTLNASFIEAGLIDKVFLFIAPKFFGGKKAITVVEGEGVKTPDEAVKLRDIEISRIGEDLLVTGYLI
jgi:diaminohydroxyphosphoribosylaminopyrimidine deaminase/5-amino-6-(5-phosphoribosylamino)uracil reductase